MSKEERMICVKHDGLGGASAPAEGPYPHGAEGSTSQSAEDTDDKCKFLNI